MFWYILLITVLSDGSVLADSRYPLSPDYNNEKTCNDVGTALMKEEQQKLDAKSGTVYFVCKSLSTDEILKAFEKPGQNI